MDEAEDEVEAKRIAAKNSLGLYAYSFMNRLTDKFKKITIYSVVYNVR